MRLNDRVALVNGGGSGIGRAIAADVSDSAQVRAMFAEVDRDLGGQLDILVNNAAIAGSDADRERPRTMVETRVAETMAGEIQTH